MFQKMRSEPATSRHFSDPGRAAQEARTAIKEQRLNRLPVTEREVMDAGPHGWLEMSGRGGTPRTESLRHLPGPFVVAGSRSHGISLANAAVAAGERLP